METKICNFCHICKPWSQFTIIKKTNKPMSKCKSCRNLQAREKTKLFNQAKNENKNNNIQVKNKNEIDSNNIEKKICSKCKISKYHTDYYKRSSNTYRAECKQCHIEINRINIKKQQKNPLWQEKKKESRRLKKEEKKEYDKKRRESLDSNYRILINKRYWNKLKKDPDRKQKYNFNYSKFKKNNKQSILSHRLRERIRGIFNNRNKLKLNHTIELLGTDCKTALEHIESKFKAGMSWENKNMWHIDHIIAICHFDLNNKEEQLKAFHYTNLQPLWSEENIEKGKKNNWISKYQDDDDLLLGVSCLFQEK